jgi:ABC-type bacteriocin/lantibiotic exporter with double-glycine peptidase domain
MRTYLAMPYERYFEKNSAQMLQTVQDYVGQFVEQAIIPTLRLISEGLICVVIVAFLAYVHGEALLLMLVSIVPVAVVYDKVYRRRMLAYGTEANLKMTATLKALRDAVGGLKELRVLGVTGYYNEKVEQGAKGNADYLARTKTIMQAPRYLLELTLIVFVVSLTVITIHFEHTTEGILPVLGMFGVAAMRLVPSANVMIGGFSKMSVGQHATHMLYEDLSRMMDLNTGDSGSPRTIDMDCDRRVEKFEKMEVRNVRYRYPSSDSDALDGISLTLSAGESIGLVGRSGSGKTTLVDVMLGLLKHREGDVLINDVPIADCLVSWRARVAYLPQQAFIGDSTVRDNVALGIPEKDIDDAAVWSALEQARLKDLVQSMPAGLHTPLGEQGIRLSGGQRQRIALARAIYHDRDILIMDESTSALDSETERQVVESITALQGKKTLIVIAHRMSTVEQCTRIYRLDKGRVDDHRFGTSEPSRAPFGA